MIRHTFTLMVIGVLLSAASGQASVVALWNFTTNGLPSNASSRDAAVNGTTSLSLSGGSGNTPSVSGGTLNLGYQGNHAPDLNGTVLTFVMNTTGATFTTFNATYAVGFSGVTALTGTWSYQLNGAGAFTSLGAETITSGSNSDTLTGFSLANGDDLVLKFTLSGAAGISGGNMTFDNFAINATITPVPEPVPVAAGIFGGAFAATVMVRRILKRSR